MFYLIAFSCWTTNIFCQY